MVRGLTNTVPKPKTGLGAYLAVGEEALRLTESRLTFELRVDRTFFKLPRQDTFPLTFGISISRNYVPGSFCLIQFMNLFEKRMVLQS